jgi:signal transduction histidine kinase/ligand-binding sensor domain-containing protein/DNA-binding response OmpR family regulator
MFRGSVFVILIFCIHQAGAQPEQFRFKRLDINQGLSNNYVTCFLKDSKGFMWFGTNAGLNRYDGYSVTVFAHDILDSTSLINSSISKLCEGPDGTIWITTPQGINLYDPARENFSRDPGNMLRKFSIPNGAIDDILRDKNGNYLFLHATEGLFYYRASGDKKTLAIVHAAKDPATICSNEISAIAEDHHGNLWIIHKNGVLETVSGETFQVTYRNTYLRDQHNAKVLPYDLMVDADGDPWLYVRQNTLGVFHFNTARQDFTHYQNDSGKIRLNTNIIRGIAQDNNGLIWIGTDHGGINLLDKKNESIRYLLHDPDDNNSLSQNTVNAVYRDDQGILWAGTYKDGISYYHPDIFRFALYTNSRSDGKSLPFNDINRFVEDDQGNLWLAANGGGLICFDRRKNTFRQFLHQPGNPNSIANNIIVSLYLDRDKKLWIGTYYGGLSCFDGKRFTTYRHDPADPGSIADDSIWEIYEDSKRNLWIGTLDGGLDRFDRKTKTFYHYPGDGTRLHSRYVSEVKEDRQGNIWIGTAYGLEMLDPATGQIRHYLNDLQDPTSISNDVIHVIHQDSRGLLWIGTASGLNVVDNATNSFRVFRKNDGLPHNTILSIVEDDAGNLWMSTPNGLTRATVTGTSSAIRDLSLQFRNYDESDGLQSREFNENAAYKTRHGELIFGGAKGFNIFHPERITINQHPPSIVLNDFQIFNRRIEIGEKRNGDVILSSAITNVPDITLQHSDNVIAIGFAALHYLHPEKNQYRYILEGFNKEWVTTDGQSRKAVYTNLDPGTYTFKVKASNNDGVWNEEGAALRITILPPFWKTRVAFVLYILLTFLTLLLARKLLLLRERTRFRLQQERQEAQRMHELDMMKIRFFTNVSHEFRTPITLILTPLEKLIKTSDNPTHQNQFQLIQRNARRLLNLVNQLLDFRKLETQGLKYNPSEGDIVQFINEVTYSFSDLSEKKDIKLSFHSSLSKFETMFDQDKLEKILFNLLSNAFKFTPEHGSVAVAVDLTPAGEGVDERKRIKITVSDTGIGIPSEKHEKIFERFFQNDLPASLVNQGSGIGLAITREFVRIQGGTITVSSEPEKGSSFTILLPAQEIRSAARAISEDIKASELVLQEVSDDHAEQQKTTTKKPILLLIEDNEDFRFYLKDNLKELYTILEAQNGLDGWQQAIKNIPDLIVSDIMMPEINGIELCRRLKLDNRTSHIPVILLTARTSEEQKLEGYETGAHDYVAKPFSFELLQSRIRNILRQQDAARKAFQQRLAVKGSDIEVMSLDEKLIQKAIALVEKNIDDPEFSVETFSHELGMSRIHLYRKLHTLTGKAPIEFIRTIRLQHAAQLLEKSQLTVSEIAYQVGFNNPKYFTRYFKEEFNMLPSVYASQKAAASKNTGTAS